MPSIQNLQRIATGASGLAGVLLTLAGICVPLPDGKCLMSGARLLSVGLIVTGISVTLWVVWFYRRIGYEEAEEREAKRTLWNASFEQFEDAINILVDATTAHLASYQEPMERGAGFGDWRELFLRVAWPERLDDGRPIVVWAKSVQSAPENPLEYWALQCALYVRSKTGADFNAQRKKIHRIVENWVYWCKDRGFKDACEEQVSEHRSILVLYLYLEYAEALKVGTLRRPGRWVKLGTEFPVLQKARAV